MENAEEAEVLAKNSYVPATCPGITSQTLGDGSIFQYAYRRTNRDRLAQNQFTDPRGYVTFFTYTGDEYTQSLPTHSTLGKPGTIEPFLQ